ncbi:MAG: bacteriohemerythrin [Nitrospinota bacterium]|nr:bacteriohemerythrin [Nitrospinota bacterium]
MAFAEWDDSYSVGVKKLDEQHKILFTLINEMNNLVMRKASTITYTEVMEEILEYTTYHFHAEEEFMRKINYPHLEEHKLEHESLRALMKKYYAKCVNEDFACANQVLEELINWLHTHLGRSDTKYALFFKEFSRE